MFTRFSPLDPTLHGVSMDPLLKRAHAEIIALKRRLFASEAYWHVNAAQRQPRWPIEFRGQFGEDLWLWELLSGQTQGFFIEVGAHDGYRLSVSYAFEAMGWNGLLIEANPNTVEHCRARRPHSRVVHAALSRRGSTGSTTFHVANGHPLLSAMRPDGELAALASTPGQVTPFTVPLTTMDALLADHQGPIDFASIDVEGHELDLLDGFDLNRYRPRVVLLEDAANFRESTLVAHMQRFGYVNVGYVWVNRAFVRTDDAALLERVEKMLNV